MLLIYMNRSGKGRGGPELWTKRFRGTLLNRGYHQTFNLNDNWVAALYNIENQGIDQAMGFQRKVGYRIASGYLPAWFEVMGRKMRSKHFAINSAVSHAIDIADVVIYQSQWAKNQIDQNIIERTEGYEIIFNGVDLDKFFPIKKHEVNIPVLGSVGLFRHRYRLETMFKLSLQLDYPHKILIIGSLDGEAKNVMSQYQGNPKISSRLTYHSYVSPDKLTAYYQEMSVFIHPVSGDVCPNVVVEALASGVPVVAPRFGGTVEVIGKGGRVFDAEPWVYDDNFVEAMTDATYEVLAKQEMYARSARQRAEDTLDIEQMATKYLDALGIPAVIPKALKESQSLYKQMRRKGSEMIVRPRFNVAIATRKFNELRQSIFTRVQNTKPRIAFTLYDFHVGGIENWLYRLASTLQEEFVFYFLATVVPEILPKFKDVGICEYIPSPNKMRAYFQRHNIDIVQVHNQRWPIDAALAAGVPHVVERTDGTRSCIRVNKSGLELVIASSRGTIPLIANVFPRDRIRLIYNGIDLNQVDVIPIQRPWSEDQFIVGRTSRFGEGKNLGLLIEAGARLRTILPQLKIVLIGGDSEMPGAKYIEAELRTQARPLGETVEFTGIVVDTIPLVKGFNVGTCVSDPNNEGIPNSLIEAMACRIPVVATDVDQVSELVVNEVNGILIQPGNVHALCDAIKRLANDADLCQRLGKAGRQTIEKSFSLQHSARKYADVYHELLGR